MPTLAELIEDINDSNLIKKEELIEILMVYRNMTHEMLHSGPEGETVCNCRKCLTKGKPEEESNLKPKPRRKLIKKRGK